MPETSIRDDMNGPITALSWEIWRRNRRAIRIIAAILLCSWLFNLFFAGEFRATEPKAHGLLTINCLLTLAVITLVFSVFNYTEISPQREWTGFPYRLFALPVSSLTLIAVPMVLSISAVEVVYFISLKLLFSDSQMPRPEWIAVLLGAYMVYYQTILWTLAGFRTLRIIVLGLIGTSFIGVAFLPGFAQYVSSPWLSEKILIAIFSGLAVAAFTAAWISIVRQRYGGGKRRSWLKYLVERIIDALPRRKQDFRSASSAQLWFEWRRAGIFLPACMAALLVLVIGPLSWSLRNDEGSATWILAWTLAMPMILAFPLGKGFSRADFLSNGMSVPAFISTRPLAGGEIIIVKMKAAALSAGFSWLLVLAFLSLWLPLWANLAPLMTIRIGFWMVYGHSVWAEYAISALFIAACMFVTWKFLIGGMWVGLSGNRKLFLATEAVYYLLPLLGLIGLTILLNHDQAVRAWATEDPDRVLAILEWLAAVAVIVKFWLAAYNWRNLARARARAYLLLWTGATLLVVILAILVWAHGVLDFVLMNLMDFRPLDVYRLRNLLVLLALLIVPFARIGCAPAALAKNRHR